MRSQPHISPEPSSNQRCHLPRDRYLNLVLTASRDAVHANNPALRADVEPGALSRPKERGQLDRDRAIGVAEGMGLIEGEATELVDTIRGLGAQSDDGSLATRVQGLDLDVELRSELECLLRERPPSAEESILALKSGYASAHRQWETHRGKRGWSLYSQLIPGLINPLVALRTPVANFAALKLTIELGGIFGRSIPGGQLTTKWIRILNPTMVGSTAALRSFEEESEGSDRIEGEAHLEMGKEPIEVKRKIGKDLKGGAATRAQ
jgi:hypothetical protein